MNLWNETKSIPISKTMIWKAYQKVRANKGSAGVDELNMEVFDQNRSKLLYKLWNRLASGSYFPPSVKQVEIPKKDGSIRKLGIPTIADRVAQMAVKDFVEPRLENIFSPNSYGYRPNKNAHQALASVRENCWKTDWVIDLDIKGFFDTISHQKLMLAVEKHIPEKWIQMYIKRWIACPVETKTGEIIQNQGKGTPQGGVISPLLANLFLHYAFDKWIEKLDTTINYSRYADDVIVHCRSQNHAEQTLKAIKERMTEVGLELHPKKTKIVYCRDYRRKGKYPDVKFDFLGYSFQPRDTISRKSKRMFLGYDCAISISSRKRIADTLEKLKVEKMTFKSIVGIAQRLNPLIRGWINYYGKFRISMLHKVFRLLNQRLIRWGRKRYKRYKNSINRACKWLKTVQNQYQYLFIHWQFGFIYS